MDEDGKTNAKVCGGASLSKFGRLEWRQGPPSLLDDLEQFVTWATNHSITKIATLVAALLDNAHKPAVTATLSP